MNQGVRSITLAALWLSQASLALAVLEEDEDLLMLAYGDKATVSLATGSRQAVRRAPAVATVITAEEIAAMGATDIDQVLETVPGLHVARAASMGASLYVMRGVYGQNAPQVLMLQNGIPVTVAISGNKGNLWGGLPVENIARIEVIRGPGSALYGADAFAGVINVITKTAAEVNGTQFGVRAGSFDARDGWVQHGGSLGSLAVAGFLRLGATDGFKRTVEADAQSRNDRNFGTQASLAPGSVNTGLSAIDGSLDLAYGKWRGRAGYKLRDDMETYAGVGSALDPLGRGKSERITADLSWTDLQFAHDWGLTAGAALQQYKQRFPVPGQIYPPGTRFPTGTFAEGMRGGPEFSERTLRLAASASYTGFAGHSLRLGLGYDDFDLYEVRHVTNAAYSPTGVPVPLGSIIVSSQPFIYPQQRRIAYFYAQDEWHFARDWTLTAGLRRDNHSGFGATTNPRLALVWDASVDVTAKLLYGTAFRAPSFTEQYSSNNPIARGNPNIQPELNNTLEAAFSWQAHKDLQLNVNFFRYRMKDIIRTTPNPAPIPGTTWNNTGRQHGSGMEFEAVWEATRNLRVTGHYAYQKSTDESTGQDAGYAPHHHVYVRGDWLPGGGWMLSGQVNYVADRRRAAGDARPAIPDDTTVDLSLRTTNRGRNQWAFAGSLRNLFNADVREPSLAPGQILYDLPGAPRSFCLQATYRL